MRQSLGPTLSDVHKVTQPGPRTFEERLRRVRDRAHAVGERAWAFIPVPDLAQVTSFDEDDTERVSYRGLGTWVSFEWWRTGYAGGAHTERACECQPRGTPTDDDDVTVLRH